MLISFSLENWMSFRERVTFSMIASRERQHGDRLAKIDKYKTRVLPIAAIYGGNASGKTNFFKALNFVKNLVVKGTQPEGRIAVEPFRLGGEPHQRPSRFTFELLIKDVIHEFDFTVNSERVLEEKLVRITSSSEKVLYHRLDGNPHFHSSLADNQFLHFAFKGTRDNQLFLTNSVSQNVMDFRPVYDWFKNTLELIAPDTRFESSDLFFDEDHPFFEGMNEMLAGLDTGIIRLGTKEISLEDLPLSDSIKTSLQEGISEGNTARLMIQPKNERILISRKNDKLVAKKLVAFHLTEEGDETVFEMNQESDGSKRAIELLPAFLELSRQGSDKVVMIDEIDRSLHPLLTKKLLEEYLISCSPMSRTQLLLTTHDIFLMDQNILRRDEMWVTERDHRGDSSIFSFSEYKDVRYDKDIRKSYLQGRLGGVPRIILNSSP